MNIFENIINHKINTITGSELLKYGRQFHIPLTREQANKIAAFLRGKNINIFNEDERKGMLQAITRLTNPETAQEINQLFLKFTK